ncbi:MAG: hypothetical protein FK732_03495 [Asgard group archaeon]|nr:hypothetical protein [Asgard group archaeon]
MLNRKNAIIGAFFGFVMLLLLIASNSADSARETTNESNEIVIYSILNNKNSETTIIDELPGINANGNDSSDLLLDEPKDIAIVTTTSVVSVATTGAISLSSLLKNTGKKFSEELSETAEVTAKIKDNIQDQLKVVISSVMDGIDTVESCPKCNTLGIGAYCYLCGTTINYEKAHLLKEQD